MQKTIAKYAVKKALGSAQDRALQRTDDRIAHRVDGVDVVDPAIAAGGGAKKKWWQRKKQPEIQLSPLETAVLKKVKKRAHLLDRGFKICCCNIGLDPLIGLIPVFGDIIACLLSLDLVRKCSEADLPRTILMMMYFNVAIDFAVGMIPIVGDIADYFYKCNTRNAVLLEEFLITRRRDNLLMEQGKLPSTHVPGTGPVPGTNDPPAAHSGPARISVDDDGHPSGVTEMEDEMTEVNEARPLNAMAGPAGGDTGGVAGPAKPPPAVLGNGKNKASW